MSGSSDKPRVLGVIPAHLMPYRTTWPCIHCSRPIQVYSNAIVNEHPECKRIADGK